MLAVRRLGVIALLLLPAAAAVADSDDNGRMPAATDLQQDARLGLPIVVMFSADFCPYCQRLEAEHFVPLLRSGEYRGRVVIRNLRIDGGELVRDFSGSPLPGREIADRYGVRFTPTVVVMGPLGQALAEPLVGMGSLDFYGAYLERAVRTAEKKLTSARAELPRPTL